MWSNFLRFLIIVDKLSSGIKDLKSFCEDSRQHFINYYFTKIVLHDTPQIFNVENLERGENHKTWSRNKSRSTYKLCTTKFYYKYIRVRYKDEGKIFSKNLNPTNKTQKEQ